MIKKYLNITRHQSESHQRSAQCRASCTVNSINPSFSLDRFPLDTILGFVNNKWFAIASMLLLQGVMVLPAQAASAVKPGQRVLMIEMTPALCSMQPSRARMRQCLEGYSFTISGLDLGYGERCGRGSEPRLTPLQLKVVNRIMPDTTVRSQVWHRYGTCSPFSASSYFRQIVNYAGDLRLPSELNTGNSYTVSKSSFLKQMISLNSGMSASYIDLICQAGSRRQSILTEIHICYEGNNFASCSNVIDSCGKKFIISGGQ